MWDLVRFARSRDILCQGRGSAANSAVCYCLGVTSVDPERMDVLFERFISRERNEAPDIDVDFEHERREEVIQYVYDKYGRERAGMTAEVITLSATLGGSRRGQGVGPVAGSCRCSGQDARSGTARYPSSAVRRPGSIPTRQSAGNCWAWSGNCSVSRGTSGSMWAAWSLPKVRLRTGADRKRRDGRPHGD